MIRTSTDLTTIPDQFVLPLMALAWLVLLVMILWDRRKLNNALRERPSLKIMNEQGQWITVDPEDTNRIRRRPVSNFYDQDERAQQPVTHRYEPAIRSKIPNPPNGASS